MSYFYFFAQVSKRWPFLINIITIWRNRNVESKFNQNPEYLRGNFSICNSIRRILTCEMIWIMSVSIIFTVDVSSGTRKEEGSHYWNKVSFDKKIWKFDGTVQCIPFTVTEILSCSCEIGSLRRVFPVWLNTKQVSC
jgi:hypothetical protein